MCVDFFAHVDIYAYLYVYMSMSLPMPASLCMSASMKFTVLKSLDRYARPAGMPGAAGRAPGSAPKAPAGHGRSPFRDLPTCSESGHKPHNTQ